MRKKLRENKTQLNFLFYLKIYLSFLGILGIYHLFYKHTGGLDSTMSEWMINYRGGFTRRGLTGELFIFLANKLEISLRFIIYLFQSFFYILFLILTFYYLKKVKQINFVLLLIIFCPLFLIYHVAELEILARKEILLFSHFYIYLFILERNFRPIIPNLYLLLTLPIIGLIWEPVVFFTFFYLFCFIVNYFKNLKKIDWKLLIFHFPSYSIFLLVLYLVITQDFSTINEKEMCSYLKNSFNERCYMSLNYQDTSIYQNFNSLFRDIKPLHVFRYSMVLLIGFSPLIMLINFSKFDIENKKFKLSKIYFLLALPIIVLYMMGLDWGRWTNISYFYFVVTTIFLINTKKLKVNFKKLNIITKKYLKTKFFLILFFIIFCFGWNTKTLYKGDIASIPGYRVPYFFLKTLYFNINR